MNNDYRKYLRLIRRYKEKYYFRVYAYCLMDNHNHLLIEEGKISLSKIMQEKQQCYTQFFIINLRLWVMFMNND